MILKHAAADVPDAHHVRDLVEQVRGLRCNKVQRNLRKITEYGYYKLDNLSALELTLIRPFFTSAMDRFYAHHQADEAARVEAQRAGQQAAAARRRRNLPGREPVAPAV